MHFHKTTWLIAIVSLMAVTSGLRAQQSQDSVMAKQVALRDDFVARIKAMGYTPSLNAPPILLDNPRSFGNYDDSANVLHTGYWNTLPQEGRDAFARFAKILGNGMTAEQFFEIAVHQWIFVHEMGHWWRACQHQTADPYENEKAANRIAAAYWEERDPAVFKLMLVVFQGVVDHQPSPVPAGISKEQYLKDNYDKLPGGAAYSWYQSIMIVELSKETPRPTFKQAIVRAGKPQRS